MLTLGGWTNQGSGDLIGRVSCETKGGEGCTVQRLMALKNSVRRGLVGLN